MQRRLHPRVRLRLPARLRWSAPLGQCTDQCETINVSRGGLLLACEEPHGVGHSVWITIPFDPQSAGAQPETLARVVRCSPLSAEKLPGWNVAMHFAETPHTQTKKNGRAGSEKNQNGAVAKISLPIRVRPLHVPWHEDAMTLEVSRDKLRFVTNRQYGFGQSLLISFDASGEAPWTGDGEFETQVTGIEMEAGSESLCVTVRKRPK
jgi:hypothetical protein